MTTTPETLEGIEPGSPALEVICQRIETAIAREHSPLMTIAELMAKTGKSEEGVRMWRKRHGVPIVPEYPGCVSRAQVMPILNRAASPRNLPRRSRKGRQG